jgi:hypothetical protein
VLVLNEPRGGAVVLVVRIKHRAHAVLVDPADLWGTSQTLTVCMRFYAN